MSPTSGVLLALPWLAWAIYWHVSRSNVKAIERREPAWSRAAHIVPLIVANLLLFGSSIPDDGPLFWLSALSGRFLARTPAAFWIGAALTVLGLSLSVWARRHIGGNWSGTVTVKRDHELIVTGPYARVRHPIYSGLLLALLGTAIARGQWQGLLGVLIAFMALWRKWRLEERWMQQTFGDAYERYRARTAALIPHLL